MEFPKTLLDRVLFVTGIGLAVSGIAISDDALTRFLLGPDPKDLEWGPALFRGLAVFHGAVLVLVSLGRSSISVWGAASSDSAENPARTFRYEYVFLAALGLLAFLLRIIKLNTDLWVDEVFTLIDFVRSSPGEIITSFPSQNQHMLYTLLAALSSWVFGESAWSIRLPAVLFGVAGIWALYFLCRKLLGVREAVLASVLMAVSYHHIWFSQNARGYTGLLFFTILATWFWFEALGRNNWIWWAAYGTSVFLGMTVHLTMAFVVASHGIVHLALLAFPRLGIDRSSGDLSPERRAGIRPFVTWALAGTVTLQFYALALPEFIRVGLHEESRNSLWTNPIWVITESLQNLSIGFAGVAVVAGGGLFFAFGWLRVFAANRRAAVLMMMPPVISGALMLALGHNLFPRFFFFAMGFALLIVIHGAMELPQFLGRRIRSLGIGETAGSTAGTAFCAVLIAASVVTVPRNYSSPKQDFSGAREFVEASRQPGSRVVAVSIAGRMYAGYYAKDWSEAETLEDLKEIESGASDLWLVYTLSPEIEAFHPGMWQAIGEEYEQVKVFPGTMNGGEIYVCRRKPRGLSKR